MQGFFFIFLWVILIIEPSTLCIQGKSSTAKIYSLIECARPVKDSTLQPGGIQMTSLSIMKVGRVFIGVWIL